MNLSYFIGKKVLNTGNDKKNVIIENYLIRDYNRSSHLLELCHENLREVFNYMCGLYIINTDGMNYDRGIKMWWKNETLENAEQKLENQKDKIYENWTCVWERDLGNPTVADDFTELFLANYEYVKLKAQHNKNKNFFYKYLFLAVLIVALICYAVFFIWNLLCGTSKIEAVLENGIILLLAVFLCNWVSKWLDIRKYQETWARHSQHKFKIDMEMLLYVCGMEPYNSGDRVVTFKRRITEIWNGNHKKFVKNMETKEIPMMQGIDRSALKKED